MSCSCCLLAVTLSCLLYRLEAIPSRTNIDVEEPSIVVSLSSDSDDGFGWRAILHQFEEANENDNLQQAVAKIRLASWCWLVS